MKPWAALERCQLCQAWCGAPVCRACRLDAQALSGTQERCPRCALRLPLGAVLCTGCERAPPHYAGTCTAVDYRHPWDRILLAFKFGGEPRWARALGVLLADAVRREQRGHPQLLLVPVPLSAQRLRERGYNQAQLLARAVAHSLRKEPTLPEWHGEWRGDILVRWAHLARQSQADRSERLERLSGVFGLAPGAATRLQGRHVALIDDVCTTGATATEASRVLMAAGAASVQLWVAARTPAPEEAAS